MRKPQTVKSLEKLGRIQLSKSFFMREFLYSEISQIESIPNIPDDPDTALAWWIYDHIDAYSAMTFFPKYAAFNISWHENPECQKVIYSYVKNPHTGKSGYLTKIGMENFSGSHEQFYQEFIRQLHPAS